MARSKSKHKRLQNRRRVKAKQRRGRQKARIAGLKKAAAKK